MPRMMEHQVEDVRWAHAVERGLLANEPGTGKSRSAIEATRGLKTLVVAPAMVLAGGVWEDQINLWAQDPDLYTLVSYTSINDRVKTGAGGRLSSTKPIPKPRPEYKGPWQAVIADESHYIKGRATVWTEVVQDLAKRAELVLPMTGTPIPNWASDVFTTLQLCNPTETKPGARFGAFWRWAEDWFDTSPSKYSNGKPSIGVMLACTPKCQLIPINETCEHYIAFTKANFGKHYRRVWRHHVLDLPPKTEQVVRTPMSADGLRAYKQLAKKFATEYQGTDVLAWSQGALNVLLDHVTVSPWFLTRAGAPKDGKLEQLRMDLAQRSRATLVLAHYQDVVEACHEVARSVGLRSAYVHGGVGTRQAGAAMQAFKRGDIDVLVGSLETVAEGHTFTNADMAIFVEKSFKTYRNEQAEMRVYRMGQEWPVTVRDYVTPNSVDANKRKRLLAKTIDQNRTMTAAEFSAML